MDIKIYFKKRINKEKPKEKKEASCLIESDDEDKKPHKPDECEKAAWRLCMILSDED